MSQRTGTFRTLSSGTAVVAFVAVWFNSQSILDNDLLSLLPVMFVVTLLLLFWFIWEAIRTSDYMDLRLAPVYAVLVFVMPRILSIYSEIQTGGAHFVKELGASAYITSYDYSQAAVLMLAAILLYCLGAFGFPVGTSTPEGPGATIFLPGGGNSSADLGGPVAPGVSRPLDCLCRRSDSGLPEEAPEMCSGLRQTAPIAGAPSTGWATGWW